MLNGYNEAGDDSQQSMEKVAEVTKMAQLGRDFADGFMDEVGGQLESMFQATMEKTAQEFIYKLAEEFMSGPAAGSPEIAGYPAPEQPGDPSRPAIARVAATPPSTPAEVSTDMNQTPGMTPGTLGKTPPYHGFNAPAGEAPGIDETQMDKLLATLSPEEIEQLMNDPVLGPQLQAFSHEKVASMSRDDFAEFVEDLDGDTLAELAQDPMIQQKIYEGLL